jgi:DNA polymerase-3 subunit epsilon
MFFIGYNSHSFDMPFVRQFFSKCKDRYFGSWFHYPSIDVMILAAEHLKSKRRWYPDFKLSTVADRMGIEVDKSRLHDALYDIELTREIYRRVTTDA